MQYVWGIATSPFARTDTWIYFKYRTVTGTSGDVAFEVLKPLGVGTAFFWDMTPYIVAKPR
jgi:hypothetical protein